MWRVTNIIEGGCRIYCSRNFIARQTRQNVFKYLHRSLATSENIIYNIHIKNAVYTRENGPI